VTAAEGRYRWVVLAVGCIGTAVVGMLRQGMPALGPAFRDAYALSVGEVGLVFGAMGVGMMVGLIPWGMLADRTGERPVLFGGLLGAAGASCVAALADAFALLLVGLFLAAFFGGAATGSSGRAIMGWFGRGERGFVLGIRQTAIPLGGALAALTLPAIALAADLQAALFTVAAFAALAAIAGLLGMREPPARETPAGFSAPPPMRDGASGASASARACSSDPGGGHRLRRAVPRRRARHVGRAPPRSCSPRSRCCRRSSASRSAGGRTAWSAASSRCATPGWPGAALVAVAALAAGAPLPS
jgi:MFS family permease